MREGSPVARREAWQEFAIQLGMAMPGFVACGAVFIAIDAIAANRWRPIGEDAAQSLALVTVIAYLGAGLLVGAVSADPDVAWGGGGVVTLFSLGTLLPVWVGHGGAAAAELPLFRVVLWLQPVLAIAGYLLGISIAWLLRHMLATTQRHRP
jgi:hypothetical protein